MSELLLTNIEIRCPSGTRYDLPNDARLFLEVFTGESTVKRTGPLERASASCWRADEPIQLAARAPSFRIVVSVEHGQECTALGSAELISADLVKHADERNNEMVRTLARMGDGPLLEIKLDWSVIPQDDMLPSMPFLEGYPWDGLPPDEVMYRMMELSNHIPVLESEYEKAMCLPDESPDKPAALAEIGGNFGRRYVLFHKREDLDTSISIFDDAAKLTPDEHPLQADILAQLGLALVYRLEHHGDRSVIDRAIFALQASVFLTRDDHQEKPARLTNLGNCILRRFEDSGAIDDIKDVIPAYSEAVRLIPEGHSDKPSALGNLGNSLMRSFELSGALTDIDNTITAHSEAVRLTADNHASKHRHLKDLGNSLARRFERSGALVDIDNAISTLSEAVLLTPDHNSDKPSCLSDLGGSLLRRFERSGSLVDINNAISAQEKAVHLTPEGQEDLPNHLDYLGVSLRRRFEHSGALVDIDKAISTHSQAVDFTPEGNKSKLRYLNNLGCALQSRFEHSGDFVDINNAISTLSEAVRLIPEGHPMKPVYLNNLGGFFQCRFGRYGALTDIDNAISAQEEAVHLTPEGHADKPLHLSNLGLSLMRRFEYSGALVDIDKSISAHSEAMRLTPEDHANRPVRLSRLGNSLEKRFADSDANDDIDRAVSAHSEAVHLTPKGHAHKPNRLSNLGNALLRRFTRSGALVDIDNAISALQEAVHLTPEGHTDKPLYLTNLGSTLNARFESYGALVDIENAISALEEAVRLIPEGHATKPTCFSSLGGCLMCRFKRSRALSDIESAIFAQGEAVRLTPEGHVAKGIHLSNLGSSFELRFELTQADDDLDKAVSQYSLAAKSAAGSPMSRLTAAMRWARLSCRVNPFTSLEGYTIALDLLPRVAWLGQTITSRHKVLATFGDLANEAATVAIGLEQHGIALEWLEQGRSIVWGQLLHLRTPVDALRDVDSKLADDLARVSVALDHAGSRSTGGWDAFLPGDQQLSLEDAAQQHHRLAEEWERLIERARSIKGFEDFLRPKRLQTLLDAAQSGPVVVLNVHRRRCDALVLMADAVNVVHIPLHEFSFELAHQLRRTLTISLSNAGIRARHMRKAKPTNSEDGGMMANILSVLWTCVVKPVLDGLAFNVSSEPDPPRIWWCATGPLAFLPIHAAGIYNTRDVGVSISDFVTSSYTPTLTVILNARASHHDRQSFQGLLAIIQPHTPGQTALPSTEEELSQIQTRARHVAVKPLQGADATVDAVLRSMETHSWVHLACHAVQNVVDPTKSAFCLHDGRLELSTLITKSFPHADLAFLSACQTATGDEKLSEESVHLAAGMLLAGYRGVIATMWSIMDKDAPVIAGEVYTALLADTDHPNSIHAAHALHHAVKHLRRKVGDQSFLSWVPFIHVGV